MAELAQYGLGDFDAQNYDTSQRSTLPDGVYELEAESAEVKETKAQNGFILNTTINVLAPEAQKGRKMFLNINIANASPVAQKIGQEELAKLCRAMGIPKPRDTDELKFKRFTAKVGLEKKQDGYDQKNKIVRYFYPDEGEVPAAKVDEVKAANDNRPAANDNAPVKAAAPAKAAGGLPWGAKK